MFGRACASCHGIAPAERGRLGFDPPPPDLSQTRLDDPQIVDIIRNGKGQMPPFGKMLPQEEVTDLLYYLKSLRQKNGAAH